ncbi:MAG TPA: hypothetical protein VGF30_16685 [Bacteroidia bacterium]
MKTGTKIIIFAAATAVIFWSLVFEFHEILLSLVIFAYLFQLCVAVIRTVAYLVTRKEIPASLKRCHLINAFYIGGWFLLFWTFNVFVFRVYLALSILVISWCYINVIYPYFKRNHV